MRRTSSGRCASCCRTTRALRPAWLIRLGLFLYDHIGGRKLLPPTRTLDMRSDPAGKPLKPMFSKAFEYSDGWVNDARLVVLNARDAADRGATIRTRAKVVGARRENGHWAVARRGSAQPKGRRGQGAADRQRRRSLGRSCARRRGRPERRAQCPARAGQPHRRAEEIRRSARLFLPEQGWPHHLRHPLRGRVHADRHDRPGLCRRPARSDRSATPRSNISATRRANISPSRSSPRTSSGPIRACARSTTTARRRRRKRRATTC